MALQILSPRHDDDYESSMFSDDETSSFQSDHILKFEKSFKQVKKIPTTAAAIKREYLLRDYSTQTDYTEILDIKYLQEMSEALVTDLNDLKSEAALTERHIKIQQDNIMKKSISEMETKHDEQIKQIKATSEKSINRIRRAAKQEVNDAIALIKANFMKWHENEVKQLKAQLGGGVVATGDAGYNVNDLNAKAGTMLQNANNEINRLNKIVTDLTSELEEAKNKKPEVIVDNTALNAMKAKFDKAKEKIEELSAYKVKLEIEKNELATEIHDLNLNIKNYQANIEMLEKEKKDLEKQLVELNKKLSIERLENAKKILEMKDEFAQKQQEMEAEFGEKMSNSVYPPPVFWLTFRFFL